MKHGIELNGVANITVLLETVKQDFGFDYDIDEGLKAIASISEQLDLLERYMLAYARAVENDVTPPAWHDVRDNTSLYPKNNGK